MKFLGIRIVTMIVIFLFYRKQVRYFKSERHLQIKHHGYKSSNDWINDVSHWNIDYDNLDGVCIVLMNIIEKNFKRFRFYTLR